MLDNEYEERKSSSNDDDAAATEKPVEQHVERSLENGRDLISKDGAHPDPDHPLNLPTWRKWAILLSVSWSGFVANYSAAAHLTAFPEIAAFLHVGIASAANAIGLSLLGLAFGPLFFNPMSRTIGRRFTMLLSTILFLPCIVWMARATSWKSFAAARFFAGFASSASQTVSPMIIADIFHKETRGDKMSLFGLFVIIGPGISPLIGAYLVVDKTWQWIYYVVLMMAGVQLVLFLAFLPETQYNVPGAGALNDNGASGGLGRTGVAWWPWTRPREYLAITIRPILMSHYVVLTGTAILYGMIFGWSVGITIVAPQIFGRIYHFQTTSIGISYLAFAVGAILGKTSGGLVGDKIMLYMQRRNGERHPEYRLWAMLPILPLLFAGLVIVGVTLTKETHWIAPLIGGGIYYYGVSSSTGLLQTYMLESFLSEPMNAMAIFQFWKCIWGFAVPFFVYNWGVNSSWQDEYIAQAFLVSGLGAILCGCFIVWGHRIRTAQGMPSLDNM